MPGSPLRGVFRLAFFLLGTPPMMLMQLILLQLPGRAKERFPLWYHRTFTPTYGLKIRRIGRPSTVRPTLYVSNHTSYLDILVLGSMLVGSFVAKIEVASWPLFGWLAKLQRSVFIDRRPVATAKGRNEMQARLMAGDSLILFPEGTSDDGTVVKPFKNALFAVASLEPNGRPLEVQPITLAYTKLEGIPLTRALRPLYAWYGDMDMASHIWGVVCQPKAEVTVIFHEPVTVERFGSRKALGAHCHRVVAEGLAKANSGRLVSSDGWRGGTGRGEDPSPAEPVAATA